MAASAQGQAAGAAGFFPVTGWSTVLAAKQGNAAAGRAALERLLARYREPIVREMQLRLQCSAAEAEDAAHDFIAALLRRDFLRNVQPDKGRFRTFVKTCLHRFLQDRHARARAAKRGGGRPHLPLDPAGVREEVAELPDGQPAPDTALDRAWAAHLLRLCLRQLEDECVAARRGTLFAALQPVLAREPGAQSHAALASRLGLSPGAVKTAASRLRQRLGAIIEEHVRDTVGSRDDWREELRYLIELLRQ